MVSGYSVNISSMLEEAGNNISDEDIAEYYRLLCDRYDLDEEISLTTLQEEGIESGVVSVEDINRTALNSMLGQAGSTIHDEELAEFYYQFLDKAGWEIEPEE